MIGLYDCKRKDIYSFDSIYPDGPFMSTCDDTSFYRKSLLLPLLLMFLWGCTEAPVVKVGDVVQGKERLYLFLDAGLRLLPDR
jgi:hypothetical protein